MAFQFPSPCGDVVLKLVIYCFLERGLNVSVPEVVN